MQENTLKKRDIEELEKLVQIAKEQGNTINLNIVYMTIDSEKIDFAEVMKYFEDRGITMIEGDVEPDILPGRKTGFSVGLFGVMYIAHPGLPEGGFQQYPCPEGETLILHKPHPVRLFFALERYRTVKPAVQPFILQLFCICSQNSDIHRHHLHI